MKTIALLTDFGLIDNFVGVMKGVILRINPRINLVDISHSIQPQDILGASFLLKSSFRYFPDGTIFLVVVDPGVGSRRSPVIVHTKNYFFVGPDNGVLSLAANCDGIEEIRLIGNRRYSLQGISNTFHGRDIFAPAAAYLSRGKKCSLFGRALDSIKGLNLPMPEESNNVLKGKVIYVDRFGSLVTNIDKILFKRFTRYKKFKVKIRGREINFIAKSYQAVGRNQPLAIFGSFGYLEISINMGSAEEYFNAKRGTVVRIIEQRP